MYNLTLCNLNSIHLNTGFFYSMLSLFFCTLTSKCLFSSYSCCRISSEISG